MIRLVRLWKYSGGRFIPEVGVYSNIELYVRLGYIVEILY